ncbi:MAG: J domain-containing protein, partial [Stenotrophomonas sp.]
MSWGHAALELEPDADERAIKRAYARRLRSTRPDEDPAAFQQLHEAYQAALAWAQYRAQWDDEGDEDEGHPGGEDRAEDAIHIAPAQVETQHDPVREVDSGVASPSLPPQRPATPLTETVEPPLDVATFAQRVVAAAAEGPPLEFERWLHLRPELWSLRDKPRVGDTVLELLLNLDAPIRMENFDALSRCFSWDEIGSGLDPHLANECRQRLHRYWVVQPANTAWLAYFLHRPGAAVSEAQAQVRLAWLTRPWHRFRSLLTASVPGRVPVMRRMLAQLGITEAGQAPPPLQPAQVGFWLDLAQRDQINTTKVQVAALRSLVCALAWWMLIFGLDVFVPSPRPATGPHHMLNIAFGGALTILVGGMLVLPLRRLMDWQSAPETPQQRAKYLRLLLIPALVIVSLVIIHGFDQRVAGTLLAVPTL